MKRFFLISFVVITFFSTCNRDVSVIRVGYAPVADASQLYIGIDKGFFEEQGITLQLENLENGPKILAALGANSLGIGLSSYVPVIYAKNSNLPFKIITGGAVEDSMHTANAVVVSKSANINTPYDLKGKKIAINGRRTVNHIILLEYLKKYGISENDVTLIEMPFPRMAMVLQTNQVDAASVIEPFVTRALEDESTELLSYHYAELYPKLAISCYISTEDWISKNKETLRKFIKAFNKATDFYYSNPEESKAIISKYTNIDMEEMQKVKLPAFDKEPNVENLQYLIDIMYQAGLIDRKITPDELILKYE
jgi:NitT/TauT family transport system substrate-binding protein